MSLMVVVLEEEVEFGKPWPGGWEIKDWTSRYTY